MQQTLLLYFTRACFNFLFTFSEEETSSHHVHSRLHKHTYYCEEKYIFVYNGI